MKIGVKMDIMKPEVYWIEDKCYRRTPCRNGRLALNTESGREFTPSGNGSDDKPYVEVDDYEEYSGDPDIPEDSGGYFVERIENGFKCRVDSIPHSLFPQIIGAKGSTKKRIEYDTYTKIIVPRQNEQGDIVIRGQKESDVRRARKRLELVAFQGRMRRDPTHFACFPLNNPNTVQRIKEFQAKVLQECSTINQSQEDLIKLFSEAEKSHLTLCVMVLLSESERQKAAEILTLLKQEIGTLTGGGKVYIHLKGLEIMNDDPTDVQVLYAKCVLEDVLLQTIANLIAKRFSESGFSKDSRQDQIKLHCTLMNSRYQAEKSMENTASEVNGGGRGSLRKSFDASFLLANFKNFDFGIIEIEKIQIATRYTTDSNGFYKTYSSIDI